MFNQISYNVIIERFKIFAEGHYLIRRFSHGQIDVTDLEKEQEFPWMHVVPVSLRADQGTRVFSFDVIFADIPRDKETNTDYQKENISDCIRLAEDLLAEIANGLVVFGPDVELELGSTITPFIQEYTHTLSGATLALTINVPNNYDACAIPADWSIGGSGSAQPPSPPVSLVLKVNNVNNVNQSVLDLVNGTNVTIEDLGDGRVRINSSGGEGSGTLVSTEFSTSHITANGNAYAVNDVVWYIGNLYRCIAANDAILPTNAAYWTLVGSAFRARQTPVDWNATSGDYQILNKPTIPSAQGLQDVITTDPVLTVDNTIDCNTFGLTIDGTSNFTVNGTSKLSLNVNNTAEIGINTGGVIMEENSGAVQSNVAVTTSNAIMQSTSGTDVTRISVSPTAVTLFTPNVNDATATVGQVLTLMNAGSGEVEFTTVSAGSGTVTSVGLTMPSAFSVASSPVTTAGTLAVTGAGASSEYIDGTGALQPFPALPPVIGDMLKSEYDTDNDGIVDFAEALKTEVRNSTGATLHKGHIVRLSGSTGNLPNAVYAQANNDANSAQTFGVVFADIPNNSNGYVITLGQINTLDTRTTATNPFTSDTLADGDVIYLSPTTPGHITNVKPFAPQHIVYCGMVVRTSPTNGTIQYRIQNGYELDELHNVVATSPVNNDYMYYDSSTSLYRLRQLTASLITDSTTVGQNLVKLPNPSAVRYLRINADNTVSALTLAELKTDLSIGSDITLVVASNVVNVGTTFEDVTGLSFAMTAGKTYKWRATISFGTVSGTIMFSTNGPTTTLNNSRFTMTTSATANSISNQVTYDSGTNVVATSNGLCTADGIVRVSASGTWTVRFRCSVGGNLTIRAGSVLEYSEVL